MARRRRISLVRSMERPSTTMISNSTPPSLIRRRSVCSMRASSSRAAITTEQRMGFWDKAADWAVALEPPRVAEDCRPSCGSSVVPLSSAGNRRTQRRCHSVPIVMARNTAVVPRKGSVSHIGLSCADVDGFRQHPGHIFEDYNWRSLKNLLPASVGVVMLITLPLVE